MSKLKFRCSLLACGALLLVGVAVGCSGTWPKPGDLFSRLDPSFSKERSQQHLNWYESYGNALTAAETSGKIVVANFTGTDWCIWCKRLERDVFDTPEFAQWSQENAVLLKLDYPRSQSTDDGMSGELEQLKQRYQVDKFPTVLILDSQGNELARMPYMPDPEQWIGAVDNQLTTERMARAATVQTN